MVIEKYLFGQFLKRRMDDYGYTPQELAKGIGTSTWVVNYYLDNFRFPVKKYRARLCAVLDIDATVLDEVIARTSKVGR